MVEFKFKVGQKVMGRHFGYGYELFIAGTIVECYEGIGTGYVVKLEPEIKVPESVRNDGHLVLQERDTFLFSEDKWKLIWTQEQQRLAHLEDARMCREYIMEVLRR